MRVQKQNLLVILPAFNEASVIWQVINNLQDAGYQNICVVDDGSSDDTKRIVENAGVVVLSHAINRGAGAAIQTGISYARKECFSNVLLMDSDGQHLVSDIESLCIKMKDTNADIVIGNRFSNEVNQIPTHRIFYNKLANLFTNFFCKNGYSDTQSGFRLLNKKAIENIQLKNRGFGFCSEMIIYAEQSNLKIEETPIQVLYSDYSLSKGQGFFVGLKTASNIFWRVVFN